jgi:phosphate acetyltransferase
LLLPSSSILLVVNGHKKSPEDLVAAVKMSREAFQEQGCTVIATVANRIEESYLEAMAEQFSGKSADLGPVYTLKEDPALAFPSVRAIARALDARFIIGKGRTLNREVRLYKVAAMQLRHVLAHMQDGVLIITPGDRADVILGCMMTLFSDKAPNIAGIILTGGLKPDPHVQKLIEGLKTPCFPIMTVETDTFTTDRSGPVNPGVTPHV